jgi:hypothetical protein
MAIAIFHAVYNNDGVLFMAVCPGAVDTGSTPIVSLLWLDGREMTRADCAIVDQVSYECESCGSERQVHRILRGSLYPMSRLVVF